MIWTFFNAAVFSIPMENTALLSAGQQNEPHNSPLWGVGGDRAGGGDNLHEVQVPY